MAVLFSVISIIVACVGGASAGPRPVTQTPNADNELSTPEISDILEPEISNNSWKLINGAHEKLYLVYRSEKRDYEFGREEKCVIMKYQKGFPARKAVISRLLYRNSKTGHMNVSYVVITAKKSRETFPYEDAMSIGINTTISVAKDYQLLFTDYLTCFTLRRPEDDVYQVWMIDRRNLTELNPECESVYGDVTPSGCSAPRPKHYIFDEEICN